MSAITHSSLFLIVSVVAVSVVLNLTKAAPQALRIQAPLQPEMRGSPAAIPFTVKASVLWDQTDNPSGIAINSQNIFYAGRVDDPCENSPMSR